MAKNKGGRPKKYDAKFAEQATKLCKLGATDEDLAEFYSVHVSTIYRWQNEFPEFCEALKVGKEEADDRVERSLYHKACGYTRDAVKIFLHEGEPVTVDYKEHVPPDTTACIFWLKNRRPELWRDKRDFDYRGNVPVQTIRVELVEAGPRNPEYPATEGIRTTH